MDIINISHGGSGDLGDCKVYIYNETGTSPGTLDGGEILLNAGGTQLSGTTTQIDIANVNVGAGYKAYFLISVLFTTTVDDVGEFHYVNITAEKDIWLTDGEDSISGSSFPLSGGPTEIIPEYNEIILPILSIIAIFIFSRGRRNVRRIEGKYRIINKKQKWRHDNEIQ